MRRTTAIFLMLFVLVGCSTTRLVPEGEYRLASNKIEVSGDGKIGASDLTPYLRQQSNSYLAFGWNPFLNIYNWSNGSGRGINGFWEKIGTPPVVFSPSLVQSTVDNMTTRLEYLGYYNARVVPEISYVRRLAKVRYLVDTGERLPIDEVVYDIPEGEFATDFFADTAAVSIRPGVFLSEESLEAETARGAAHFRDLGYYRFNKNNYFFEADTLGGRTVLYYRVRGYTRNENASADAPINRYRIAGVNIWHPADLKFRESLLRKLNRIQPGDYYSETMVNTTYQRLSALNVFNSVNIEMTPVDSSHVNCDIRLGDSNLMGFKINAEVSSNSSGLFGASPQLSFYHKNLFNGGERLNVEFTGNWQFMPGTDVKSSELGVSASLSFPRALGYPLDRARGRNIPRTEVSLSYNYQNRPEYRRSVAGLSFGYTGQIGNQIFYQLYPLQIDLVKLYDISGSFAQTLRENPYLWDSFQDQIDAGIGLTLYHTSDASIVPKSSYGFSRLSFDLSGNLISLFDRFMPVDEASGHHMLLGLPYNQYVRAELELGKVFRYGRNEGQAIAMRLDMGVGHAYGNSTALPFEKQFYAGGASSMRGWQVRTLGPGFSPLDDSFVIPSQTGDVKLEANLEYRFDMFWKLEGAVFAEVGNVWRMDSMKDDFLGSLAADWGVGLRVNLDFILLRIDAGFKLHDPARPAGNRWLRPAQWVGHNGYAIHFGVGYPF